MRQVVDINILQNILQIGALRLVLRLLLERILEPTIKLIVGDRLSAWIGLPIKSDNRPELALRRLHQNRPAKPDRQVLPPISASAENPSRNIIIADSFGPNLALQGGAPGVATGR